MPTLAEIRRRARVALIIRARRPRDGDGDGFIDDGKPTMRPAPRLPAVPAAGRKWHRSLSDFRDLIAALRSGEKKRYPLSGGQMGKVFLVDHNDGTTTVEKRFGDIADIMGQGFEPQRQADAEQLAAALGRAIGAPVPRVLRTADDRVSIDLVNGDTWKFVEDEIPDPQPDDRATLRVVRDRLAESRDGIRLGLFDLLTDNWDRANGNNWYVEDDTNRPVGIDHALAWSEASETVNGADPPTLDIGPFAAQFLRVVSPQEGWRPPVFEWAPNPLTVEDIAWLRDRLAAVEDDFSRLGRHDWWEFAMRRLEAIAPHASGEGRVFG